MLDLKDTPAALVCAHYFHLDPPHGPTSTGVCTKCGTTRTFPNSGDYYTDDNGGGLEMRRWVSGPQTGSGRLERVSTIDRWM